MKIAARILAGVACLAVLWSGVVIMVNPTALLPGLALTPDGIAGLSNLRGLLGGAQVTFGILLAIGALKVRKEPVFVAAMYFGAVVIGRLLGLALDGYDEFSVRATVFAVVLFGICLSSFYLLRRSEAPTPGGPS